MKHHVRIAATANISTAVATAVLLLHYCNECPSLITVYNMRCTVTDTASATAATTASAVVAVNESAMYMRVLVKSCVYCLALLRRIET
jgi:hypothetical protein